MALGMRIVAHEMSLVLRPRLSIRMLHCWDMYVLVDQIPAPRLRLTFPKVEPASRAK